MKQHLLVAAFSLITVFVKAQEPMPVEHDDIQAQDSTKRSRLFVSVGAAFPSESFKGESYAHTDILWAEPGPFVSVGYVVDLQKHVALGVSLNSAVFPVNTEDYKQGLNTHITRT